MYIYVLKIISLQRRRSARVQACVSHAFSRVLIAYMLQSESYWVKTIIALQSVRRSVLLALSFIRIVFCFSDVDLINLMHFNYVLWTGSKIALPKTPTRQNTASPNSEASIHPYILTVKRSHVKFATLDEYPSIVPICWWSRTSPQLSPSQSKKTAN